MVRTRAALAVVLLAAACTRGAPTTEPTPVPGCAEPLEPLRRHLLLLSVGGVVEHEGRDARQVVARELLPVPVFVTPEADSVDVRWWVSPDFEEILSTEVGLVSRRRPLSEEIPSDARWISPSGASWGRLVSPRAPGAVAADVLPEAKRAASGQSGRDQPACQTEPAQPGNHQHRWSLRIHGVLGGQPVSERLALTFPTPEAFEPGGTRVPFRWSRGDYSVEGKVWLAADYRSIKVRLIVADSRGATIDEVGGGVAGIVSTSSERAGLASVQVSFPNGKYAGGRTDIFEPPRTACSTDSECSLGRRCSGGVCEAAFACVMGPDTCVARGDRVACTCADGTDVDAWRGARESDNDRANRVCGAVLDHCITGQSFELVSSETDKLSLTTSMHMVIAHEP